MKKILIPVAIVAALTVLTVLGHVGYKVYKLGNRYNAYKQKMEVDVSSLMDGQTAQTIEQTVAALKQQNLLNDTGEARYIQLLTANLEWFEQNGTGTANEFEKRITATADSLKPLMANEQVISSLTMFFRVVNLEFGRQHALKFSENVIKRWVSNNLSFSQKLNMVKEDVIRRTEQADDMEDPLSETVYANVRERLLTDMAKLSADSSMSSSVYEAIVQQSLQAFDQMELKTNEGQNYSAVILIPKTYHAMSTIIGANVLMPLTDWYHKHTAYTPPSFGELEKNTRSYLAFMVEAGLVSKADSRKLEAIVSKDIEMFRTSADSVLLTRTAITSLNAIEQLAGDTEDREVFARLYCDLAQNKGFSIGKQVSEWMYGKLDKELEEEEARKLPWEG